MKVSIIAAMGKNRVIGKDNDLIWNLPGDMRFFKNTTSGHHIIMGRKNFQSMNKPLPNRVNVVVTRDPDFIAEGAVVVHSIEEGLAVAEKNGEQEAFIIGGGNIYAQSLELADRMYLTFIDASFEGDTFFPEVDFDRWKLVESQEFEVNERDPYPYRISTFEKNRDI